MRNEYKKYSNSIIKSKSTSKGQSRTTQNKGDPKTT